VELPYKGATVILKLFKFWQIESFSKTSKYFIEISPRGNVIESGLASRVHMPRESA
jgi:hypothetical protein